MKSNIEIIAAKETGLLGRVAVHLTKKGFKINRQTVTDQEDGKTCLMALEVESSQGLTDEDIAQIKADIDGIVGVMDKSAANLDVKALLDQYGPQLISSYPKVQDTLKKCTGELPASGKPEVLSRLGRGLGRWQYGQNYALGGLLSLDKTLQRMLWPSLEKFLDIEADGNRVKVKNCPVCASSSTGEDNCHFIAAYIEGFLGELAHLSGASVVQSAAAAAGSPHCSFEVRGDAG